MQPIGPEHKREAHIHGREISLEIRQAVRDGDLVKADALTDELVTRLLDGNMSSLERKKILNYLKGEVDGNKRG